MPKFMTYQRPTPVNKANWGPRTGANPYQPVRRNQPAQRPDLPEIRLDLPGLPGGPRAR